MDNEKSLITHARELYGEGITIVLLGLLVVGLINVVSMCVFVSLKLFLWMTN